MMKYNFNNPIPRQGTNSIKYDQRAEVFGRSDVLPMWVADMDFSTPPFVIEAISKRLSQKVLGYTKPSQEYFDAICHWNNLQYDVKISPEMISYVPGVVNGIYLATQVFSEKGDRILVHDPVYPPFRRVPEASGRQMILSPLRRTKEGFEMDIERFRHDVQGCKIFILCNPHNPGGICWQVDTLREIAHICHEAGVIVVSDEIHCDMLHHSRKHIPFASVSEEAKNISITLQACTKTYNLPGVVAAQAIVYNPQLRQPFFSFIQGSDMDLGNIFAFDCVCACYSPEGLEWKKQMLEYVQSNIDILFEHLPNICPNIIPIQPQASFLVFLDCHDMGFPTQTELVQFFVEKARLGLNSGIEYGPSGKGYMRMNLGCTHATLYEALSRLEQATQI